MCHGEVLFWSCLFGVLKASWTWMFISFPRFGKFSTTVSLKRFFYTFNLQLIIHKFGLLMVSHRPSSFHSYFSLLLSECDKSSNLSLTPHSPSST
jgi:hypothetical protein